MAHILRVCRHPPWRGVCQYTLVLLLLQEEGAASHVAPSVRKQRYFQRRVSYRNPNLVKQTMKIYHHSLPAAWLVFRHEAGTRASVSW